MTKSNTDETESKFCNGCSEDVPQARFSKKQWRLGTKQRRCKCCIESDQKIAPFTTIKFDAQKVQEQKCGSGQQTLTSTKQTRSNNQATVAGEEEEEEETGVGLESLSDDDIAKMTSDESMNEIMPIVSKIMGVDHGSEEEKMLSMLFKFSLRNRSGEKLEMTTTSMTTSCYHSSTEEHFATGSKYRVVADKFLLQIYEATRIARSGVDYDRKKEKAKLAFEIEHIRFMLDPEFAKFLFSYVTTLFLSATPDDLDKSNTKKYTEYSHKKIMLLNLAISCKYWYIPGFQAVSKVDHVLLNKYSREVMGDDRNIINMLSRETRDYCNCMQPRKEEVKGREKLRKCDGCSDLFPKLSLKSCKRCNVAIYCSRNCQIEDWYAGHKEICKDEDYLRMLMEM